MKHTRSNAFSLAEVLLAAGTIVICILTLCVLLLQLLRSSRKTVDVSASELAAEQIISRVIYNGQYFDHTAFWAIQSPPAYKTGTLVSNRTEFAYQVDAVTVMNDNTGGTAPVGGTTMTNNRLKLVTLHLTWWDGASGGNRAGYGKLSRDVTRLVHEEQ
ncbi:MAG: hypothetical protein J0I12_15705 [Candidatus Eremiobacteraeota bacterium]|nr:hypothetical protein [Candidatus Eremiobacteraeota bacterium]